MLSLLCSIIYDISGQAIVPKLHFWENGLNLELDNGDHVDTVSLKDIILGKDRESFLIDQYGDTLNYASIRDKVILLDFWYLRCPPCIAEITGFDMLKNKFRGKDFQVISMTFDDKEEVEEKLLSKRQFKFPIFTNTRLIGKVTYPLKILINKQGDIVYVKNTGSQADDAHIKLVEDISPHIKRWMYK